MEGRPVKFHSYSDLREAVCEHFGLVEDVNGSLWIITPHFKQKEVEDSLTS